MNLNVLDQITKEEVLPLFKNIEVDKSPGPDQVYLCTLWKVREEIAGALAEIFPLLSLAMRNEPVDRRVANVVPLYIRAARTNQGSTGQQA